jgi:hypothetical protein
MVCGGRGGAIEAAGRERVHHRLVELVSHPYLEFASMSASLPYKRML